MLCLLVLRVMIPHLQMLQGRCHRLKCISVDRRKSVGSRFTGRRQGRDRTSDKETMDGVLVVIPQEGVRHRLYLQKMCNQYSGLDGGKAVSRSHSQTLQSRHTVEQAGWYSRERVSVK